MALALDRDFAGAATVVSITDDLMFFGEMGAGLLALLVFAVFAVGLLETGTDFASLRAADFLATGAAFTTFAEAGAFFTLEATGAFFGAATFFATGLDLAATATFFAAGLLATGLALALVLDTAAFAGAFALGFAAGLARAATLVDLAVDLVFFMIFAISVLTL